MPPTPEPDNIAARIAARIGKSPFNALLGIQLVDAHDGWVRLSLPMRDEFKNVGGTLHGGIISTLCDVAAGMAMRTRRDEFIVTIDLNTTFLAPATGAAVYAEATVVSWGKRILVSDVDILDADRRLLAKGRATYTSLPTG